MSLMKMPFRMLTLNFGHLIEIESNLGNYWVGQVYNEE